MTGQQFSILNIISDSAVYPVPRGMNSASALGLGLGFYDLGNCLQIL